LAKVDEEGTLIGGNRFHLDVVLESIVRLDVDAVWQNIRIVPYKHEQVEREVQQHYLSY